MSASERVRCPVCATSVSKTTLAKCGGVCRRCFKQPINYRRQWIFLGVLTLAAPVAAILIDQELAALEASGGTRSVHSLIALAYNTAGRPGVCALFIAISVLALRQCIHAYRRSQAAKKLIATEGQPKGE